MKPTKVNGTLYVQMFVTCPKCDCLMDLFVDSELNSEGELWSLVRSRYDAGKDPWTNIDKEFKCTECETNLIFNELEY